MRCALMTVAVFACGSASPQTLPLPAAAAASAGRVANAPAADASLPRQPSAPARIEAGAAPISPIDAGQPDSSQGADDDASMPSTSAALSATHVRVDEASALILDGSGEGLFVADSGYNAVLRLNLTRQTSVFVSGCTQHSEQTCPGMLIGGGPSFARPDALQLDPKRHRLWVGDTLSNQIFSMDLSTGERAVLSGEGPALEAPRALVLTPDGDHVWVLCQGSTSILEVDLTTGKRNLLTGCSHRTGNVGTCPKSDLRGDGPEFQAPQSLMYDAARSRLLVTDLERTALLAVNIASGDRSFVTGCTEEPPVNRCKTFLGSGEPFYAPTEAVIDPAGDRVIAHSVKQLTSVDLSTGDRTVMSAEDAAAPSLRYIWAMTLDPANSRILLFNSPDLVSVALSNGARSVVAGSW